MSGRAYSMKEMKVIVEYLVQRKAYGEVKGRKMWMDLANSPLTIRTWQSLKETFIKRILPDIHNPYYKLTVDQIRSFREGCDTEAKEKNKLEIVSVGDSNEDSNSNTNAEKQVENEQPSTSHENNGEAKSGEDVTCSKVDNRNRDSVDTIILPTCYETAEDLQRVLESPNNDKDPHSNQLSPPHKTLKDCITYSEPLSVMLQEVLHDFGTDNESDDEMKMQIVETHLGSKLENEQTETNIPDVDLEPIVILDTEDMLANNKDQEPEERAEDHPEDATNTEQPKVSSLKLKKSNGGYEIDNKRNSEASKADERVSSEVEPANQTTEDVPENSENQSNHADEKKDKEQPNHEKSSSEKCFPSQSTTADSILPNNQEALKKSESNASPNKKQAESEIPIQSSEQPKETVKNTSKKGKSRKRAISQDVTSTTQIIKKPLISKKTSKDKAVSDTDTIKKNLIEKTSKSDLAKMAKQIEKDNTKSDKSNKKGEKVSENIVENTISAPQEESHSMTDLSQSNPCLQSVSLFEEQFKKSSYVTSDENEVVPVENTDKDVANKNKDVENKNKDVENKNKDVENRNKDVQNNKKDNNSKKDSINDVVILKSHSDSESELEEAAKKSKKYDSRVSKPQREKVLANVFGFSSGAVGKKRKKSINYRKHHYHTTRHQSSGESSDWTSESDSEEYVSPPRGRRNRQTRKYLKPQSARILSLEEEGGLFVMYGKKIYPLVKDGKIMKNYLTYLPESDPEDEESYWKTKYIEEKQRAEELKKLVVENEQKHFRKSPILLPRPSRHISNEDERRSPVKRDTTKHNDPEPMPVAAKENTDEENNKGKTLKITFAKNNQEVHVEGHWSNIHPVLAEVVQIFNNDNEARKALSNGTAAGKQLSDASSDKSVAIVPIYNKEAHEKINRLEAEIFKEIQRRDREEQELDISSSSAEEEQPGGNNVTKRKRGIRIRSSSSRSSKELASTSRSPKRQKTETTETDTKTEDNKTTEKANEIANNETPANAEEPVEKRASRTRQKSAGKPDVTVKSNNKVEESGRKSGGKSQEKTDKSKDKDTPGTSKSIIATRAQTRTPKKDEGTPKSIKPTRQSKTSLPESVSSTQADDDEIRYMFPPKKSGRKPVVTGKKDKR